jgi:hypothetical protein
MIDQYFIDASVEIRREWVRLIRSLDGYQEQIEKSQRIISEKQALVEDFGKKKLSIHDKEVKDFVEKIFNDVEFHALVIESKIKPINDQIEKLKKEELTLYRKMKMHYPNYTDEKLKDLIYPHIKDINP